MRVENWTKTRVWEDTSLCPETSTKKAVQEFHLRTLHSLAKVVSIHHSRDNIQGYIAWPEFKDTSQPGQYSRIFQSVGKVSKFHSLDMVWEFSLAGQVLKDFCKGMIFYQDYLVVFLSLCNWWGDEYLPLLYCILYAKYRLRSRYFVIRKTPVATIF